MNLLPKNVGQTDRIIRIGLSIGLTATALYVRNQSVVWAIGLSIVALVLLITALIGTCPLYLPFGISTRRLRKLV